MDFDPSLIFGEEVPHTRGLRKICTDHKRCGMGLTCEHAQVRNESAELLPLWVPDGADNKACANWEPRKELQSENDIYARKRAKHNPLRRSNLIIPEHLKRKPDPMTKRHIKDGRNIKGED